MLPCLPSCGVFSVRGRLSHTASKDHPQGARGAQRGPALGAEGCSLEPRTLSSQNCQHNTEGPQCNKCKAGFFGDATKATATACRPCPCPYIDASRRSDPAREGADMVGGAGRAAGEGHTLGGGGWETWVHTLTWSLNCLCLLTCPGLSFLFHIMGLLSS